MHDNRHLIWREVGVIERRLASAEILFQSRDSSNAASVQLRKVRFVTLVTQHKCVARMTLGGDQL